jgi:hypothetical protein
MIGAKQFQQALALTSLLTGTVVTQSLRAGWVVDAQVEDFLTLLVTPT